MPIRWESLMRNFSVNNYSTSTTTASPFSVPDNGNMGGAKEPVFVNDDDGNLIFIKKEIVFFKQPCMMVCDGKCNKAWGTNNRPTVHFEEDTLDEDDDFAYLSDDELGEAPDDPGTYEGGHGKPRRALLIAGAIFPSNGYGGVHNKWCARECERCEIIEPMIPMILGEKCFPTDEEIKEALPDFSVRIYNIPYRKELELAKLEYEREIEPRKLYFRD